MRTLPTTNAQRVISFARNAWRAFIDWLCGDISLTGHYD